MPQQTKIFRVFVSSTFTDMREERRILQKIVFPKLEKFCESNGAKFQAVDLRWGVNEESQRNQKTLEICLNEIARCQRITPKPNFLILIGNKYGWLPLPPKIPKDEMKEIQTVLTSAENKIIDKWYWLDENAIPAEFVLQPRENEYEDYDAWKKVEAEIRDILINAVSKSDIGEEHKLKYTASATHQEIMNGALSPPEDTERPEEHVFAYIRNIRDLPNDKSAIGFIDLINDTLPDKDSQEKLDSLKSELSAKLDSNKCISYDAQWEDSKSNIDRPIRFAAAIHGNLKRIIREQIKQTITTDDINREIRLHREFKDKLNLHFYGREEILTKIKTYINGTERKVFSMIGESGSGKSSVMAKAISDVQNENAVTVFRFIGITSSSSNIISLLQSICGQIARKFNTDLESLAGEGKDKALFELNGLMEIFRKCLALGTPEKPVVVFLDALDQLSDTDNARALNWLQSELPENAKLVVSALPELEGKLNHTSIAHLPLLPKEEAEIILGKWLNAISRQLTKEQHTEVINKFNKTGLPIYLKIAFEKAKNWHSYDKNFLLKDGVDGVINDFIDGLIKEGHDADFVEHVICYMLSGRYQGLAENEILEILVFDEDYWKNKFLPGTHEDHREEIAGASKIPIVVWSRFFLDMEPFLTERDADGVPIITFFHRQFVEVLQERYKLIEKKLETEPETS